MTNFEALDTAYYFGRDAREANVGIPSPYEIGSAEDDAWWQGWLDEDNDRTLIAMGR